MAARTKTHEVSEEQVLWFRARRGHLAGPGAESAAAAAGAIIGAQAQQLPPSLHALSMRTAGRPTAADLKAQLLEAPRRLVRIWGQRETLHLYDPQDWATVVAARDQWGSGGRGGPMPTKAMLDKALKVVEAKGQAATRSDLITAAPASYVKAVKERAAMAGIDPKRLAAGRLIWRLALRGDLCLAGSTGKEQSYAARKAWHPELNWPSRPPSAFEAATALAQRYLATYGPATPKDVAHFFHARVTDARKWLAEFESDLVAVRCRDRKDLVALKDDVDDLAAKPPAGPKDWPVRLLPLYDTLLMAHADKSWTVPLETERTLIWRKAAYVAAIVLDRGRAVATWSQRKRSRRIEIEISPLSGWRKSKHLAPVRREANALAVHLGVESAAIE